MRNMVGRTASDLPAIPRRNWDAAAVFGSDNENVLAVATKLRRRGIPTEALYGPGSRKSLKKRAAAAHQFEVVVDLDRGLVKDMILGGQKPLGPCVVGTVRGALEGFDAPDAKSALRG